LEFKKGANVNLKLKITHPDLASLNYKWELLPESEFTGTGGDVEKRPDAMPINVKGDGVNGYHFKAPFQKGAYRIFVYIYDTHEQVACANFPFWVK
jgi:hypothetical protein